MGTISPASAPATQPRARWRPAATGAEEIAL